MKSLERLSGWIFGLAFLLLAFAVAIETFARKVFNTSLQGVDELGGYVLAVGAGLSFTVALASRAHIRIDVVHDVLPRLLRAALNVLATLSLAVCAVGVLAMAWYALGDTIQFNATAQSPWATPLKYPQTLWVTALAIFAVFALFEVVRVLAMAAGGKGVEIDRRYGPRGAKDELEEELVDLKARGVTPMDAGNVGARP